MKSCHKCGHYGSGKGDKFCLSCKIYDGVEAVQETRKSPRLIPTVQTILEAVPVLAAIDDPLMGMMRKLPAQHAAIIAMRFYAFMSLKDIGEFMRISEPAVSARIERAMLNLKKNLHEQYPDITCYKEAKRLIRSPH